MDTDRFDAWTRGWVAPRSRRGIAATLVGGVLGVLGRDGAAARRRRCPAARRCAGRCCPAGQVCYRAARACCTPNNCQSLDAQCGEWPDGCGRTLACGACPEGWQCRDGGFFPHEWVLSGGPAPTDPLAVDDDLYVGLLSPRGDRTLLHDADQRAGRLPPVAFTAEPGDRLRIYAIDVHTVCRSLGPLWLHNATTGRSRQLTPGVDDGCVPGGRPDYIFFDQTFEVRA